MNRKPKRHSAPSAAAGSAAQAQAQAQAQAMLQWGAMGGHPSMHPGMLFNWGMQPPQGTMVVPATQQLKPWEAPVKLESESDSDSDFQPSQKSRKTGQASAPKKVPKTNDKRGPGRPPKKQVSELEEAGNGASTSKDTDDFSESVPAQLYGQDDVAPFDSPSSCIRCGIYVGSCVLRPCGHGLFCKKCVNGLREETIKMKRFGKCLSQSCVTDVKDWWHLKNVSG